MKHLPINCIFDKGRVGGGGTTIALKNDKPYVIAVPYVSLIESNTFNNEAILGVTGDTSSKQIKDYLSKVSIPKIMMTYDSIDKVNALINPQEFALLIDEYHLLFTQYSFRMTAAKRVLDCYSKYNEFCFMTATLLEQDFILEELKHLNTIVAEWEDVREVIVNSMKCTKNINPTVINLINDFLKNKIEGNAYIFVNSVDFIKQMVNACNLTDDNTRAIWSKHNRKEVGLNRATSLNDSKKINLLTSSCFEGVDFHDKDAKIYIVSDSKLEHTLVDISTSFQQIAGRVRDTKYWNQITHIYSNTRYNKGVSYEEYKASTNESIESDQKSVIAYNNLDAVDRAKISMRANETYIDKDKTDDIFYFDANKVKIDLYNFKITNCLYSLRVNVTNELKNNGYTVKEYDSNIMNEVVNMDKLEVSFEETVKVLEAAESSEDYDIIEVFQLDTELHKAAFAKYPFLENILKDKKLGFDFIKECKYNQTNIKRKFITGSSSDFNNQVFKLFKLAVNTSTGTFISSVKAKEVFDKIYTQLKINKTGKGTDLKKYFEVKDKTSIERGYIIVRPKAFFD